MLARQRRARLPRPTAPAKIAAAALEPRFGGPPRAKYVARLLCKRNRLSNGKVIADHRHEELGDQVLFILGTDLERTRFGRVPDHVQDQPQEAIDEGLPGMRFAAQALLQQLSIYLKERHVRIPSHQSMVRRAGR